MLILNSLREIRLLVEKRRNTDKESVRYEDCRASDGISGGRCPEVRWTGVGAGFLYFLSTPIERREPRNGISDG